MKYLKLILIGTIISITSCTLNDDIEVDYMAVGGEIDDLPPEEKEIKKISINDTIQLSQVGGEIDDIPPED